MMARTWPWGEGAHRATGRRSWCSCGEWCYEPADDQGYELLCHCCREPLYIWRIAELEAEVSRFRLAK